MVEQLFVGGQKGGQKKEMSSALVHGLEPLEREEHESF
jgi:hypothetical protein